MRHAYNAHFDRSPKLLVLVYHRVLEQIQPNPLDTKVTLRTFKNQLDGLLRRYPVISLDEAIRQCRSGEIKAPIQAVVTFDDGYADNYEIAFPILREKGVCASFFLVTDYIEKKRPL